MIHCAYKNATFYKKVPLAPQLTYYAYSHHR
ncbi:hypothetical protein PSAR109036_03020 [Psychrobacter arenosus]